MIALLLGVLLGASLTVFTLQNAGLATVQVFAWHFTAPLAFTLIGVVALSAVATLLAALPTLLKLERQLKTLKIEKKAVSDDLAKYSITIPITPPEKTPASLPVWSAERESVALQR